MRVYGYRDYDHYVEQQTLANVKKLNRCWATRDMTSTFAKHYRKFRKDPATILCHGSRNGMEVRWFGEEFPEALVLGTDISYTATKFPNQVQWDMQKENPDWIGKWDMIYTNSLDHVTDFHGTLRTIFHQLTMDGLFILDYTIPRPQCNDKPTITDPLDVSYNELKQGLRGADFKVIQENQYYEKEYADYSKKYPHKVMNYEIDSYYFICQKNRRD